MGPSPKPKSNPRLVEPINRGFSPHFPHISASPEFRAQTTRSIQLPSEKDQKLLSFRKESTTCRSGAGSIQSYSAYSALSFRKESTICRSGARSIQSSSARFATFEIKRSRPQICLLYTSDAADE